MADTEMAMADNQGLNGQSRLPVAAEDRTRNLQPMEWVAKPNRFEAKWNTNKNY